MNAADNPDAAAEMQRQLISVLESDAPKADQAITCKRLAIYGTGEAVPALAPLLRDEELASWARIALEAIPDPAADEVLRAALDDVDGRLLIGVINSIGVRGDAGAVDGLTEQLKHADADAASAAALALGRIGNASATETLQRSLAAGPAAVRSAVAEGCILCAEKLLAKGNSAAATELYDEVRQAAVPKQRVLEATRGAILSRKAEGVPLLVEQLQSSDKAFFRLGLSTARELRGAEVTEAVLAEIERTSPDRQALLLYALADRGDVEALPGILKIAGSAPSQARIAALGVVKRLGNASCVPTLLEIAVQADADVSQAARDALESLPGDGVDDDLASRLASADGKMRLLLIQLAGLRGIAAMPALLKAVNDPDASIRTAALMALGETVDLSNLPVLIQRVVDPQFAEDTGAAEQALRAACIRMPDRETCAAKLADEMSRAPVSAQCAILEILSAMGGETALQTVGAAAKSSTPELQDAGSRLLGEWMTVDAAPVLLDLAKTADEGKYQIRAVRGYIRIVRQFDIPARQRADMCRTALQIAKRDAEKKLILEVLQRYPNIDTLKLAIEMAETPALKNDASAAAMVIAQKVGGSADVRDLLTQVGQDPVKVDIVKAQYGTDAKMVDVTETLRKHVRDFPLIVLPSSSYNSSFGGDPVPGVVKQLKIEYRMDGKPGEASFAENETIVLPVPR
jgi:HEAT repeat protein